MTAPKPEITAIVFDEGTMTVTCDATGRWTWEYRGRSGSCRTREDAIAWGGYCAGRRELANETVERMRVHADNPMRQR